MPKNINRSTFVTIKKTSTVNGVTTIINQTNKTFGSAIMMQEKIITFGENTSTTNPTEQITTLTNQISQLTSNINNSFTLLTGTINTLSTSINTLSASSNTSTIITLPSSISSSKTIHYYELTSSLNVGDSLKFSSADFSTVNFKNNVSVFVNGLRLITDVETNSPEVFPVSGSSDTIKFNITVPEKSLITMEVYGSIIL